MDPRLEQYFTSLGITNPWLEGWKIDVAQRDGVDCGFVLTRGCEIHILPLIERRAITRKNIRAYIAPLLDEFGYVTTRVPIDVTEHRLREKLGFRFTWADNNFSYWALTDLPYSREGES